jgi:hypothetical protein
MNDQEVERIAVRTAELVGQTHCDCSFNTEQRRTLHAFAEATNPEAAGTLGKLSRAIESTSNRLMTLGVWMVAIFILTFIGSLGYDKLMSLMPK